MFFLLEVLPFFPRARDTFPMTPAMMWGGIEWYLGPAHAPSDVAPPSYSKKSTLSRQKHTNLLYFSIALESVFSSLCMHFTQNTEFLTFEKKLQEKIVAKSKVWIRFLSAKRHRYFNAAYGDFSTKINEVLESISISAVTMLNLFGDSRCLHFISCSIFVKISC